MATKKAKQQENPAPAETKKKTLDELLKAENPYEKAVAEYIRNRHDANLERAIVENQRSIQACMSYIAGKARQKAKGKSCVMMSDSVVFSLATHWFLDGDTPIEGDRGAAVEPASQPAEAAPAPKPKSEKKPKKAKTEKKEEKKKDDSQLLFGFWDEAKTEKKEEP